MLSIISVYNNKEILENNLLKSLRNQTIDYELILVDNTKGEFKSAAKGLNYGAKKIKSWSRYIMFVHQDVDLCSNTCLKDIEKILDTLSNLGIVGVAGKSKEKKGIITNITHGTPPKLAGEIQIKKPTRVQTVDECLMIISRQVFNKLQFDEKNCNDWHLYGVDYALSVRKSGFYTYVIPISVYHRSNGIYKKNHYQTILPLGVLPKGYYQTLRKLLKKHRNSYKKIYTTCGDWYTIYPLIFQRIYFLIRRIIKFLLKNIFKNNKINKK